MRGWSHFNPDENLAADRIAMRSRSRDRPLTEVDVCRNISNRGVQSDHRQSYSRRTSDAREMNGHAVFESVSQSTRRLVERSRSRDCVAGGSADCGAAARSRPRRSYGLLRAWSEDFGSQPHPRQQAEISAKAKHRYTGRERFEEGHDNRHGGNFSEYFTPRRRHYSHRERWEEGHDDRDGYSYNDHAPSVRPTTDSAGFICQ
mmetsp:Transcript_147197/g.256919  ORF Transcript_147197/g.256919 Transcript_147197/m.256919 type:complete len:203 (-) Transcript_147197:7-615(-)